MCLALYDLFIHTCLCSPNRIYYSPHLSYSQSKLANILFTYELDRRLKKLNSPVTVNAIHPGVVNTDLFQYVHWLVRIPQKLLANLFFMVSTDVVLCILIVCFALHFGLDCLGLQIMQERADEVQFAIKQWDKNFVLQLTNHSFIFTV